MPILDNPLLACFSSEEDSRYFEVFSLKTSRELFPSFEFSFGKLRIILLQACESYLSIRHAAIALGALDKTSEMLAGSRFDRERGALSSTEAASWHYERSLTQYSKALELIRQDVASGRQSLRATLLGILVTIIFEGWCGSGQTARNQIRLGNRLVAEWKEQLNKTGSRPAVLESIDEDLLRVYPRLSQQLITSFSAAAADALPDTQAIVDSMPREFRSIEEAGRYANDALVASVFRFAARQQVASPPPAKPTTYPINFFGSQSPDTYPPEMALERSLVLQSAERWIEAMEAFKSRGKIKAHERSTALIIELHVRGVHIPMSTLGAEDETIFDRYTDIFSKMLDLAEKYLKGNTKYSNVPNAPKFCLDMGLIMTVWSVGTKCRDHAIRQRAISLLLDYPRREGIWDSTLAGRIIQAMMGLEEAFMEPDSGHIPGWARLKDATVDVDLESRNAILECEQYTSADCEKPAMRRKLIPW